MANLALEGQKSAAQAYNVSRRVVTRIRPLASKLPPLQCPRLYMTGDGRMTGGVGMVNVLPKGNFVAQILSHTQNPAAQAYNA